VEYPALPPEWLAGAGVGGFVSNMAAATAGSVIGHTIAHGVLGLGHSVAGDKEAAESAAPEVAPVNAAAAEHGIQQNSKAQALRQTDPCYAYQQSLLKCLDANNDVNQCTWANDMFKDCKTQYASRPNNINRDV